MKMDIIKDDFLPIILTSKRQNIIIIIFFTVVYIYQTVISLV